MRLCLRRLQLKTIDKKIEMFRNRNLAVNTREGQEPDSHENFNLKPEPQKNNVAPHY
jgi:hypothetical protein